MDACVKGAADNSILWKFIATVLKIKNGRRAAVPGC